jgi:hypothetical protein
VVILRKLSCGLILFWWDRNGSSGVLYEVIHVVEAEKHVEMLPGTEIMADIAAAHFVHAHNTPNATVLVPQPIADIHDPLARSVAQNK